ncbi:hypothetical protein, partial [Caballeronia glebae]|uniref:hypothetical protein n=1 Tax=Caballeronia glebae TaxID=1777143 RepID=UPI0038B80E7F
KKLDCVGLDHSRIDACGMPMRRDEFIEAAADQLMRAAEILLGEFSEATMTLSTRLDPETEEVSIVVARPRGRS